MDISADFRRKMIIRLIEALKESPSFCDIQLSQLKEAVLNSEHQTYQQCKSKNEYVYYINEKLRKIRQTSTGSYEFRSEVGKSPIYQPEGAERLYRYDKQQEPYENRISPSVYGAPEQYMPAEKVHTPKEYMNSGISMKEPFPISQKDFFLKNEFSKNEASIKNEFNQRSEIFKSPVDAYKPQQDPRTLQDFQNGMQEKRYAPEGNPREKAMRRQDFQPEASPRMRVDYPFDHAQNVPFGRSAPKFNRPDPADQRQIRPNEQYTPSHQFEYMTHPQYIQGNPNVAQPSPSFRKPVSESIPSPGMRQNFSSNKSYVGNVNQRLVEEVKTKQKFMNTLNIYNDKALNEDEIKKQIEENKKSEEFYNFKIEQDKNIQRATQPQKKPEDKLRREDMFNGFPEDFFTRDTKSSSSTDPGLASSNYQASNSQQTPGSMYSSIFPSSHNTQGGPGSFSANFSTLHPQQIHGAQYGSSMGGPSPLNAERSLFGEDKPAEHRKFVSIAESTVFSTEGIPKKKKDVSPNQPSKIQISPDQKSFIESPINAHFFEPVKDSISESESSAIPEELEQFLDKTGRTLKDTKNMSSWSALLDKALKIKDPKNTSFQQLLSKQNEFRAFVFLDETELSDYIRSNTSKESIDYMEYLGGAIDAFNEQKTCNQDFYVDMNIDDDEN